MGIRRDLLHQTGNLIFLYAKDLVPPDEIEGQIFRHLGDPGGRICLVSVATYRRAAEIKKSDDYLAPGDPVYGPMFR